MQMAFDQEEGHLLTSADTRISFSVLGHPLLCACFHPLTVFTMNTQ